MRLTRVVARDFLAFRDVDVSLDRAVTVVVGPNGSGKSTLVHAVDLVVSVLNASSDARWDRVTADFTSAGHRGARDYEVRLGVEFDRDEEAELLLLWLRAALLSNLKVGGAPDMLRLDEQLHAAVDVEGLRPLLAGTIIVRRQQARPHPWVVAYEFESGVDATPLAYVGLLGDVDHALVPGGVDDRYAANTARLNDRLLKLPNEAELNAERITIADLVRGGGAAHLVAEPLRVQPIEAPSIRALYDAVGYDLTTGQRQISLEPVLARLVSAAITLTDNHRAPIRTRYHAEDLAGQVALRDGSFVPAAVERAKNGDRQDRARWHRIRDNFRLLSGGRDLEVVVGHDPTLYTSAEGQHVPGLFIAPIVESAEQPYDIPMRFAGAGAEEAAFIATLLGQQQRVIMLDEPATNLSTTAQRRLLSVLRNYTSTGGQVVLITHSPDLVRVQGASDLRSIIRLSPGHNRTRVHGYDPAAVSLDEARFQQLFTRADVRSILFAAGLVLLEGGTELGALDHWLSESTKTGLPTPDECNVRLLNVDGDARFGQHVEIADVFGIPWVALADAPVFVPGSKFEKQLTAWDKERGVARLGPAPKDCGDFAAAVARWNEVGVYTFATGFRSATPASGRKAGIVTGEVEEWLHRLDSVAYNKAVTAHRGSKPRVGAEFAAQVPVPRDVIDLWRDMLTRLGVI